MPRNPSKTGQEQRHEPTVGEIIADLAKDPETTFQMVHNSATRVRRAKADKKRGLPEHIRLEISTDAPIDPIDVYNPRGSKVVGIVLWVPTEKYLAKLEDADVASRKAREGK